MIINVVIIIRETINSIYSSLDVLLYWNENDLRDAGSR